MALEERLYEELPRSAEHVRPDLDQALARVVESAGRRRRQRHRVGVMLAGLLFVVGVGFSAYWGGVVHLGGAPDPAHPNPTTGVPTPSDPFPPARHPGLTGEWQTAPLPIQRVRSALDSAGLTGATADRLLGGGNRWVVQLTFSTKLLVETWDPGRPLASVQVGDDLVYRLVPHHRVVIMPVRPTTHWFFGYTVVGDRLRLHYAGSHGQPAPLQTARLVAGTAAPLRLVR